MKMAPSRNSLKWISNGICNDKNTIIRQKEAKKQSGRSMVEMLGVLAIIGVLSVGGIAGYTAAMDAHKLNQTYSGISLMVQDVRLTLENEKDTSGLDFGATSDIFGEVKNPNATAMKILEKYPIPYPIYLTDSSVEGENDSKTPSFDFRIAGMSRKNCIKLLMTDWEKLGKFYGASAVGGDSLKKEHSVSEASDGCDAVFNESEGMYGIDLWFLK